MTYGPGSIDSEVDGVWQSSHMRVKVDGITVSYLSCVPAVVISLTHHEVVVTISQTATEDPTNFAAATVMVSVARIRIRREEHTHVVVSTRLQLNMKQYSFYYSV